MSTERTRLNQVPADLRSFAQGQRSQMPRAEDLFWQQVRAGRLKGHKFKRQVPIAPYVVDFLCVSARVVVELDGSSHDTEEAKEHDAARDAFLKRQGFAVLRFPNDLVLGNCQVVLDRILAAIEGRERGPSPAPLRGAPSPAEGRGL